jgi:hypothetical protein
VDCIQSRFIEKGSILVVDHQFIAFVVLVDDPGDGEILIAHIGQRIFYIIICPHIREVLESIGSAVLGLRVEDTTILGVRPGPGDELAAGIFHFLAGVVQEDD